MKLNISNNWVVIATLYVLITREGMFLGEINKE